MNIEQEIRAQIEKNKGLKLAVGEINNHLSILEGLLRNERDDVQKQVNEAYQRGLQDGKEYREKGCEGCKWENKEYNICTTCRNSYKNLYERKDADDEIKVGDEVTAFNELTEEVEHFVVIEVGGYFGKGNVGLFALYGNNKSSVDFKAGCFSISAKDVTKTGRHFDIPKILKEMKE